MSEWETISYIISSKYRKKILKILAEGPATPSGIAKKTGLRISHVSMTLKQLLNKQLIVCLTPTAKKGRLYKLSDEGGKIVEKIFGKDSY